MLIADTRSRSLLLVCITLSSPAIATDPCCRTSESNAISSTWASFPALLWFIGDLPSGAPRPRLWFQPIEKQNRNTFATDLKPVQLDLLHRFTGDDLEVDRADPTLIRWPRWRISR